MPVLVAVGCSSSLGSLALQRFLLATTERWTVYAAHRSPDPPSWEPTHDRHDVEWIPLELESLASVKKFAQQVTPTRVDLVWLNAAVWDNSAPRVVHLGQAEWTREAVVNCIAQHYLVHLLADKLACPLPDEDCGVVERARIVVTTSNLHKSISTLAQILLFLRAATPPPPFDDENQSPPEEEEQSTTIPSTSSTPTPKQRYAASKAAQLLSAFYWRRHFSLLDQEEQEPEPEPEPERGAGVREGQEEEAEEEEEGAGCSGNGSKRRRRRRRPVDVVAVSPGFVPATNLSRDSTWFVRWLMRHVVCWFPFAVSVEEGAARIARSLQPLTTASSPRSNVMVNGAAAAHDAAEDDEQQRQKPSAPHPNEEEGDSTALPLQPDSNATATSTSESESESQALEALLRTIPPLQILYLSLPSTAPLPGPSPDISLSRTLSPARGDNDDGNRDREGKGREEVAPYCEYLVQGGAVGDWAAKRGGCDWDEVEGWGGILPSREDLDRFAQLEAEG